MTAMLVGLPFERVKFELGDSNLPPGGVSGGSATTAGVGQAMSEAAGKFTPGHAQACPGKQRVATRGLTPDQVVFQEAGSSRPTIRPAAWSSRPSSKVGQPTLKG